MTYSLIFSILSIHLSFTTLRKTTDFPNKIGSPVFTKVNLSDFITSQRKSSHPSPAIGGYRNPLSESIDIFPYVSFGYSQPFLVKNKTYYPLIIRLKSPLSFTINQTY